MSPLEKVARRLFKLAEPPGSDPNTISLDQDTLLARGEKAKRWEEYAWIAQAAIEALDPSGEVERPFGDAGDAIDFALDHTSDSFQMFCFLEDWRSDRAGEWPGYMKWLQTQRDGALTQKPRPISGGERAGAAYRRQGRRGD
jgi:hypothetical protein